MASILVISDSGRGLPIAYRLADEGHIVKVWYNVNSIPLEGRNPSVVQNPQKMLEQYDLVLYFSLGSSEMLDPFFRAEKPVLGSGGLHDNLLLDEDYQNRVLNKLIPEEFTLSIAHAKNNNKVEAGIPQVFLQGWFNGKDFLKMYTWIYLYDRFLEADRGCKTEGEGSLVIRETNSNVEEAFNFFSELLNRCTFVGPVTLSINEGKITYISLRLNELFLIPLCELLQEDLFSFLWGVVTPSNKKTISIGNDNYALCTRLSVPPYPYKGDPKIVKLDPEETALPHVWWSPSLNGSLSFISARGSTIREAQRRVQRTIKNVVKDQDIQYRRDIGEGLN